MGLMHVSLLGGLLNALGLDKIVAKAGASQPSVDDIMKDYMPHTLRQKSIVPSHTRNTRKKNRWRMAKMSRKVNYARNGTRG